MREGGEEGGKRVSGREGRRPYKALQHAYRGRRLKKSEWEREGRKEGRRVSERGRGGGRGRGLGKGGGRGGSVYLCIR